MWEAMHFGFKQRLTVRIVRFVRPFLFEDEMLRGAFRSFKHAHLFRERSQATEMIDMVRYTPPLGPLGVAADELFLKAYLRRFLSERTGYLKKVAENSQTAKSDLPEAF